MIVPSPRSNRKARIEIIPLIDVIFFLLATFVMVSLSMIQNRGIVVNLPVAAAGAPQDREGSTVITVTEHGEIRFNREEVNSDGLKERLLLLKSRTRDPKVFVNGDAKASLGALVTVMDQIRQAGIAKIAIQTKAQN